MKKRFKVDVDCGEIVALVVPWKTKKSIPIKKGKYKITMSVPTCWRDGGTINHDFLDVKEDSYLAFADGWYLDEDQIEYIQSNNVHKRGFIVGTGGDGNFFVNVELKKISKIPYNPHVKRVAEAKKFLKSKKFSEELAKQCADKFLHNVYTYEINEMLQSARIGMLRNFIKNAEKALSKMKKKE